MAHRGGLDTGTENTMTAFEHAVGLGYRYVETDVHLTADGVLVAFHDDRLDRVTDATGAIADLTWDRVRRARVAGVDPIPRFEELLAAWPDLRINIDPKDDRSVEPLADALLAHDALDRVCVGAFSDRRLGELRARCGPGLCTSMGPKAVARLIAASRGIGRASFVEHAAQVPRSQSGIPIVTRRFVDAAHRAGVDVHVWTVNDANEMRELLELGVDGLITDRPGLLREVLIERDEWESATTS